MKKLKQPPNQKSSLSTKLRYSFGLFGIKVKLNKVSLGLDMQYDYKSMISVMPEGIIVGELRNPNKHHGIKYDIYTPDGDEIGTYYLFSLMFQDLVTAIANSRIGQHFDSIQYSFDGPPE